MIALKESKNWRTKINATIKMYENKEKVFNRFKKFCSRFLNCKLFLNYDIKPLFLTLKLRINCNSQKDLSTIY